MLEPGFESVWALFCSANTSRRVFIFDALILAAWTFLPVKTLKLSVEAFDDSVKFRVFSSYVVCLHA